MEIIVELEREIVICEVSSTILTNTRDAKVFWLFRQRSPDTFLTGALHRTEQPFLQIWDYGSGHILPAGGRRVAVHDDASYKDHQAYS